MKTPTASIPQDTGISPTGASVPRTGQGQGQAVANLAAEFDIEAAAAGLQTGGEEKTTVVPPVPRVPIVPRPVAAPAGLPFPQMTDLQPGETPQVVLPTGSIMGTGGRKKRKSMKKKQTKKRKSMKKKKTMKRKSMKRKSMKKRR